MIAAKAAKGVGKNQIRLGANGITKTKFADARDWSRLVRRVAPSAMVTQVNETPSAVRGAVSGESERHNIGGNDRFGTL